MRRFICFVLVLMACSFTSTAAQARERYFLIIFGSESTPRIPRYTHTFATAIKVCEPTPGVITSLEAHTISWLPQSLKVRILRLRPEPGFNLDLHRTLHWAIDETPQEVSMWGPYEIPAHWYCLFLRQYVDLIPGQERYKAVDPIVREHISDCIHAVTDMDPVFERLYYPIIFFGNGASWRIVRVLQRRDIIIDPDRSHPWLIPMLGLDQYPIRQRYYRGPFFQ